MCAIYEMSTQNFSNKWFVAKRFSLYHLIGLFILKEEYVFGPSLSSPFSLRLSCCSPGIQQDAGCCCRSLSCSSYLCCSCLPVIFSSPAAWAQALPGALSFAWLLLQLFLPQLIFSSPSCRQSDSTGRIIFSLALATAVPACLLSFPPQPQALWFSRAHYLLPSLSLTLVESSTGLQYICRFILLFKHTMLLFFMDLVWDFVFVNICIRISAYICHRIVTAINHG